MKSTIQYAFIWLLATMIAVSSCQKGDLLSNPNVAAENSTVPVALIFNHLAANTLREEEPVISTVYRYNQNIVSNYSYYFGTNTYNWSNTNQTYDIIRYCDKLDEQVEKQYAGIPSVYRALSKFYKAYAFIWLTQRVGDIPMSQAGDENNLTPSYDSQHDVYKNSLALLDTANTILGGLPAGDVVKGDIYGLTNLQWQKVVNTYKLRVLISLSKRADDNADLNIKSQFAAIVSDAAKYPIMTSNADNLSYKYTTVTLYPPNRAGYAPYNNCENISQTFLNITAAYSDPRVFALTIPAQAQITGGKQPSDFTAYVGENNAKSQGLMSNFSTDGKYSNLNYVRYMSSPSGANAEPYILLGYPELCFNIAEAANRGWVTGVTASDWYYKGIDASMAVYGLTQGQTLTIKSVDGNTTYGTATIDINAFKANANVAYNDANGLTQILTQKYVAFFMNSGFESYYNWRRTGIPAFSQGDVGIGTANNQIPLRWQYPQDEITYNNANYTAAVSSQYGGNDDVNAKMWLIK
ncbi:MAG: SusD/RagB family nutrient-binding outer membrane lipoprotein [Chitinophagaceae bacterium]